MVTNGLLYLLNTWLRENGITNVKVGASKNKALGYVFGLYELKQEGQKRRKFIYKTPDFDEMAEMLSRTYNLGVPPFFRD